MCSQVCNLSFLLLISCFGAATLTSALPFCKTKPYIFTWFQMLQLPSTQLGYLEESLNVQVVRTQNFQDAFLQPRTTKPTVIIKHFQCLLKFGYLEIHLQLWLLQTSQLCQHPIQWFFPFYLDIFAVTVTCNAWSSSREEMWVAKAQQSDVEIHGTFKGISFGTCDTMEHHFHDQVSSFAGEGKSVRQIKLGSGVPGFLQLFCPTGIPASSREGVSLLTLSLAHHLMLHQASLWVSQHSSWGCVPWSAGVCGHITMSHGWDMLKAQQFSPLCAFPKWGMKGMEGFGIIPWLPGSASHGRIPSLIWILSHVCHSFPAPEGSMMGAGWIRN